MSNPTDSPRSSRRTWLKSSLGAAATAGLLLPQSTAKAEEEPLSIEKRVAQFRYCLNTSTIGGQNIPITDQVDIAAEAGYDAIEPWIRDILRYVEQGHKLPDLKRRIADRGLTVESAIGFGEWIVDDEARRTKGLETMLRDMELVKAIGGTRIAASPAGATKQKVDLLAVAERYRVLLEVGVATGVTPQLEMWGSSKTLSRLGELMFVAVESGHPSACVMPDVYHIYKGGSEFSGVRVMPPAAMHVFHVNDYPADPPREKITDADRIYPGTGVAPLGHLFRDLERIGFRGVLSLELFNREYWKQDPRKVAKHGLKSMKQRVEGAFVEAYPLRFP